MTINARGGSALTFTTPVIDAGGVAALALSLALLTLTMRNSPGRYFVGSQWVASSTRTRLGNTKFATREVIAHVPAGGPEVDEFPELKSIQLPQ
jgi:hypothetical protein